MASAGRRAPSRHLARGGVNELQRKLHPLGACFLSLIIIACGSPFSVGSSVTQAVAPLPSIDPGQAARGRQLYVQECASCHGTEAEGAPRWRQPDAAGNLPPPPHDDAGHTWRHSDRELTDIIRDGLRDRFNKSPDLTMPAYRDKLTAQEIAELITYFKSLWSDEHRRFQEEQNLRDPPVPMESQP